MSAFQEALQGSNHTIHIGAVVDYIFCGIAKSGDTTFASMALIYSPEVMPTMVHLALEMNRQKKKPLVKIQDAGNAFDLMVLFSLNLDPNTTTFDFLPPLYQPLYRAFADSGSKVIATAEAYISYEDLMPFLDFYKTQNNFVVSIMESENSPNTGWSVALTDIERA